MSEKSEPTYIPMPFKRNWANEIFLWITLALLFILIPFILLYDKLTYKLSKKRREDQERLEMIREEERMGRM